MDANSQNNDSAFCTVICWLIGLLVAVVAGYMLMILGGLGIAATVFCGLIIFALVGFMLSQMICGIAAHSDQAVDSATLAPRDVSAAAPPAASAPSAPAPSAPSPHRSSIDAAPLIKPSAALAGEAELASRKGSWSYKKEKAPAAEGVDYDGDGVVEGTDEGTKPETLTGARDGKPDDLKQIKGVGPKLEGMLHGLGFYHFDQVANWTSDEVAWVDANLEGFKGRVSRDNWVSQAQILAAGGATEFSQKVEDGGVYD